MLDNDGRLLLEERTSMIDVFLNSIPTIALLVPRPDRLQHFKLRVQKVLMDYPANSLTQTYIYTNISWRSYSLKTVHSIQFQLNTQILCCQQCCRQFSKEKYFPKPYYSSIYIRTKRLICY